MLIIDTKDTHVLYAVYEHWAVLDQNAPPELVMVGVCQMRELAGLHYARTNTEWSRLFARGGQVGVKIAHTGDKRECTMWAKRYLYDVLPRLPRCNALGSGATRGAKPIMETTTGQRFNSIQEAAKKLSVHAPAIQMHLKGHGHTVGKPRYRFRLLALGE